MARRYDRQRRLEPANAVADRAAHQILKIPHQAILPITTHYVKFWFGRKLNETGGNDLDTPLIEACKNNDESSVFILLHWEKWNNPSSSSVGMRTAPTTSSGREDGSTTPTATRTETVSTTNTTNASSSLFVDVNKSNRLGMTALHGAAKSGSENICRLLLDHKSMNVDINIQDAKGFTPLHWAVTQAAETNRNDDIIKLLLKHGANVNILNRQARRRRIGTNFATIQTPLDIAADEGKLQLVQTIMTLTVDSDQQNHRPTAATLVSALNFASKASSLPCELVKYLANHLLLSHQHDQDVRVAFSNCAVEVASWLTEAANNILPPKDFIHSVVWFLLRIGADSHTMKLYPATRRVRRIRRSGPRSRYYRASPRNCFGMNLIHHAVLHGFGDVVGWFILKSKVSGRKLLNAKCSSGWTPLHYAVKSAVSAKDRADMRSKMDILRSIVDSGVNLDSENKGGYTALHFACGRFMINLEAKEGEDEELCQVREEAVEYASQILIHKGASVDKSSNDGSTPLILAVKSQGRHATSSLRPRDDESTLAVAQILLQAGADINATDRLGMTVMHHAAKSGSKQLIQLLMKYGTSSALLVKNNLLETPLFLAVTHNSSLEAIEFLLQSGPRVAINHCDHRGCTPLKQAVIISSSEKVSLLLNLGAHAEPPEDGSGTTPIQYAIMSGAVDITRSLLYHGANMNTRSQFFNSHPLMIAVEGQSCVMVKLLLEHGADRFMHVACNDDDCTTPLESAVCLGCESIVEVLMKHGADPKLINPTTNKSPLDLALEVGNESMTRLLLSENSIIADGGDYASANHNVKRQRTASNERIGN